jgi:hypothetical protein
MKCANATKLHRKSGAFAAKSFVSRRWSNFNFSRPSRRSIFDRFRYLSLYLLDPVSVQFGFDFRPKADKKIWPLLSESGRFRVEPSAFDGVIPPCSDGEIWIKTDFQLGQAAQAGVLSPFQFAIE